MKIKATLAAIIVAISFITPAFAKAATMGQSIMALGAVSILNGGALLAPGVGILAAGYCYENHCLGTSIDDFVPADMDTVSPEHQNLMLAALEFHSRHSCGQMRGGQWATVASEYEYNSRIEYGRKEARQFNYDHENDIAHHDARNMTESDLDNGLYVHQRAQVVLAGKANMGVNCVGTQQVGYGSINMSVNPLEIWVNKKGQVVLRTVNANPRKDGYSVTTEATWDDLAKVAEQLHNEDQKSKF